MPIPYLIRFTAAVLSAAVLTGCLQPTSVGSTPSQPDATVTSDAAMLFGNAPVNGGPPPAVAPSLRIVILGMDVVRVQFTADDVRDTRKVWNHADELRLGAEMGVQLARNGLRIAVGSADAWAAIKAIVDASKAEVEQETILSEANMPLLLPLGHTSDGESIFVYLGPGRLSGKSFPPAEKLLKLEYRSRPESGNEVDLRLAFEVREDLGVMAWEKINGTIREVPAYNRHTFEELSPLVTMRPGEFLIIGLGEGVDQPNLLGNRFLTAERGGRTYETLLFLSPRLMERQAPAGTALNQP